MNTVTGEYDDQPPYRQGYVRRPGDPPLTQHDHLAEVRRALAAAERRAAAAAEARAHRLRYPVEVETPGHVIVRATTVAVGDWVWLEDKLLWGQVTAIEPAPEGHVGWSWSDHSCAEGVVQPAVDANIYTIRRDP